MPVEKPKLGDGETSDDIPSLVEDFWSWRQRESPYLTAMLGRRPTTPMDRLDAASVARRVAAAREFSLRLQRIVESDRLRPKDRIDAAMLACNVETFAHGNRIANQHAPIGPFDTPVSLVDRILDRRPLETLSDARDVMATLEAFPRLIEDQIDTFRRGIEAGRTLHTATLDAIVKAVVSSTTKDFENDFAWTKTLGNRLKAASGVDPKEAEDFLSNFTQKARSIVIGASRRMLEFLVDEYRPRCRKEVGLSSLLGGEAVYRQCLKFHADVNMGPREIHELGLAEVARLLDIMNDVARYHGFAGDLDGFRRYLDNDPAQKFSSEEEMLEFVIDLIERRIRPRLDAVFHDPVRDDFVLEIHPVRDDHFTPAGCYYQGTLDGSEPGKFYLNVASFARRSKYNLATLCLHEAEPGHHTQTVRALSAEDLPEFRRMYDGGRWSEAPARFPVFNAFNEGWALYAESLGNELGLYDEVPLERFGANISDLARCVRLVLDTGLHAFGWSKEKAVDYFVKTCPFVSSETMQAEVDRYVAYPGQACSYKIGAMTFHRLRDEAEVRLGDHFDLKDFHREVLDGGSLSLNTLETVVHDYIDNFGSKN